MKLRCLAVDDEKLALDLLEDNIKRIPSLELVATCDSPTQALELLQREKIDLVFADIQMPGLTGIQFLESLGSQKPMFIFVTAHREYAVEGFNLDVIDYLLKPVPTERFVRAVNKAVEYIHLRQQPVDTTASYIFVHAEYSLVKIDKKSIIRIEGLKDYVKIFLSDQPRPVITRTSMKSIEERLGQNQFVRVHKSHIINLESVIAIRKGRIKLPNAEVPISNSYSSAFYKRLGHDAGNE
jgi:DNA-binding LytR/AlgR family response regulator